MLCNRIHFGSSYGCHVSTAFVFAMLPPFRMAAALVLAAHGDSLCLAAGLLDVHFQGLAAVASHLRRGGAVIDVCFVDSLPSMLPAVCFGTSRWFP